MTYSITHHFFHSLWRTTWCLKNFFLLIIKENRLSMLFLHVKISMIVILDTWSIAIPELRRKVKTLSALTHTVGLLIGLIFGRNLGQYALRRKSHHRNLRSLNQRLSESSFIRNSDVYIDDLYFDDIHFIDLFPR